VTVEVVAEIAVTEERSQSRIRIGQVPRLHRGHNVVRRDSQSVSSAATDAHLGHDPVTEVLAIPVKCVRASDDAQHRHIELGCACTVVKRWPDVDWKPFDPVVRLAGADDQPAGTARSRPQSKPLSGRIDCDGVFALGTGESGRAQQDERAQCSNHPSGIRHGALIPSWH
jgi:hypothetical protein